MPQAAPAATTVVKRWPDMGGKQSAPASPNYQPIATASTDAAKIQAQTSQDQLDWSKQQYADQAPATKDYLKSMIANTDQQTTNAKNLEDQYTSTYQPLMSKFAAAADSYS